jgi:hypothetical protein
MEEKYAFLLEHKLNPAVVLWQEGEENGVAWRSAYFDGDDIGPIRYCAMSFDRLDLTPGAINGIYSDDCRPPADELDEKLERGFVYALGERRYKRRDGVLYVRHKGVNRWKPLVRRLPTWRIAQRTRNS